MTDADRNLLADHVRCAREATAEAHREFEKGGKRKGATRAVLAALIDAEQHTTEAVAILAASKGVAL